MKFSALSLLLVASASAVDAQIKTISAVRCFTKLGPSSTAKVATVSRVLTIPLYAQKKRTVTPTKVITPPPVLTTTTGTVTETKTETITVDTTSTIAPVVTATPAGFQPIESTLPGAGDAAPAQPPAKRVLRAPELEDRDSKQRQECKFVNGQPVFSPAAYPKAITCAGLVLVVSTKITTVTAKSTATTTLTAVTLVGEALTTTTTTVTATVMNTITPPQATEYAACAANNIATQANGLSFYSATVYGSAGTFTATDAKTPYDCCVSCQTYSTTTPGQTCAYSLFYASTNRCILVVSTQGTCLNPSNTWIDGCSGSSCSSGTSLSNGCLAITRLGQQPV